MASPLPVWPTRSAAPVRRLRRPPSWPAKTSQPPRSIASSTSARQRGNDPSSKEDPVQQIVRYVNQIREGKFKTPKGRDIIVNNTTPFYGYVVCDFTPKVKKWLELEQQFTQMPDGLGWFRWFGNISLYMEVVSWTKLLRDAEMRNKIFFNKLGID